MRKKNQNTNNNHKLNKSQGRSSQVETFVMPDICTSLNNCAGGDYCKECSHALFRHSIKIKNRIYKFEFNQWYGVTFLKKNDEPSSIYLSEKHPFWIEFQKWYDEKFKA